MAQFQEEVFVLVRDIRKLQIELEHIRQAARIKRRAFRKEKKRKEEGQIEAFFRASFMCDECGVIYAESESRVFKYNDTFPELLVCVFCNKILNMPNHTPQALVKWFPSRFNKEIE